MTIYMVSGFMRSGTSMMMKALIAGGMKAAYSKTQTKRLRQFDDDEYKVNDGGFYELSMEEFAHPEFPDNYDGKLVKCLWNGMWPLKASGNTKEIIFMRRPINEIARSYEAAFGYPHPKVIPELANRLDCLQGILEKRRDIRLHVVQYHDVLADPYGVFESLGWPIDAMAAAKMVNPELYRHRHARV